MGGFPFAIGKSIHQNNKLKASVPLQRRLANGQVGELTETKTPQDGESHQCPFSIGPGVDSVGHNSSSLSQTNYSLLLHDWHNTKRCADLLLRELGASLVCGIDNGFISLSVNPLLC